jgi:hypothetical protein
MKTSKEIFNKIVYLMLDPLFNEYEYLNNLEQRKIITSFQKQEIEKMLSEKVSREIKSYTQYLQDLAERKGW